MVKYIIESDSDAEKINIDSAHVNASFPLPQHARLDASALLGFHEAMKSLYDHREIHRS